MTNIKIAFHTLHDFHCAVLAPIYHVLQHEYQCLLTSHIEEVHRFHPDILVLADHHTEYFRERLPDTLIIWARHGLSSKNQAKYAVTKCDITCVSSDTIKEYFIHRDILPRIEYWVTGFPAMDDVFNMPPLKTTPQWPAQLSLDQPTLLYAPTYNTSLSAETILHHYDWIGELRTLLPRLNIIIKPHPVIPQHHPHWMTQWHNLANRYSNIYVEKDTHSSIYRYFSSVDLMLSDVSSAYFYFLACDKPIVLVTNPHANTDTTFYDAQGPEWLWRNCATDVSEVSTLARKLVDALAQPNQLQQQRLYYQRCVYGNEVNGESAKRIARQVHELIQQEKLALYRHVAKQIEQASQRSLIMATALSAERNRLAARLADRFNFLPQVARAIKQLWI
jgi:hypothetical protein